MGGVTGVKPHGGYGSTSDVRVWRVSSFGGHRFAPTLVDLPEGRYWGNITPERMGQLLHRSGDPSDLMDCYRGWAALPHPGQQVLERHLFRTQGWRWIGQQLELREVDETPRGSVFAVTPREPGSGRTRHYEALLERTGSEPVLVGCDGTAGEVQRYAVSLSPEDGSAVGD